MKKYLSEFPVYGKYSYIILKYYIIILFLALAYSISYIIIENTHNSCQY